MYTGCTMLYISPAPQGLPQGPLQPAHLCASPATRCPPPPQPAVGFPAPFQVSRTDTALESRALAHQLFVTCSSPGGLLGGQGGGDPFCVPPRGAAQSSSDGTGSTVPVQALKEKEENVLMFIAPCHAACSPCATLGAGKPLVPSLCKSWCWGGPAAASLCKLRKRRKRRKKAH